MSAILGDPRSEWAEIIRRLKTNIIAVSSNRSGRSDKGASWAARQVIITLDTLSDPRPGGELPADHPIKKFIALTKDQAPEGTLAGALLLETYLSMYPFGDQQASWENAQSALGLSRQGLRSTGLAPLTEVPEGATPFATPDGLPIVGPDNEPPLVGRIFGQDSTNKPDDSPEGDPELEVEPYDPYSPNAP